MKNSKDENYRMILKKIEQKEKKKQIFPIFIGSLVPISVLLMISLSYNNSYSIFQNKIIWNKQTETHSILSDVCGELKEKDITKDVPMIKNWILPKEYEYTTKVKLSCDGNEELSYYEISGKRKENDFEGLVITIQKENRGPDEFWCFGGMWESILKLPRSTIYKKEVILVDSGLATFEHMGYFITIEGEEEDIFELLETIIK